MIQLTNLSSLALDNNQISIIPDSFGQLPNLEYLHIYNNNISKIPDSIGQLSKLRSLHLYNNNIDEIPNSIGLLSNLQQLYLYNNNISEIPDSIGHLSNLKFLHLHNNKIGEIPDSFGQLSNLQRFRLDYNNISIVPDSIGQLSELQDLSINNNNIRAIPNSIGQLSNLRSLYLSGNNIDTIPDSIAQLSKLQFLSLAGNRLIEIPNFLGRLSNLQELFLVNNQVTSEIPITLLSNRNLSLFMSLQMGSLPSLHFADLSEISYKNLLSPLILQAKENNKGFLAGTWNITNPAGSTTSISGGNGNEINRFLFETPGRYLVTFTWTTKTPYFNTSASNFTSEIEVEVEKTTETVHQVTLITRYLDHALPENTATYQVEHNASFLKPFETLKGYGLYNSTFRIPPVFDVDMEIKTVGLSIVDRDYTIVLEFDRARYKVNLKTSYLDEYKPDLLQTDWIPYQTGYIQVYEIAEGYQIANLNQLPADVIVDENTHTVTINSVIQDYDIILELEKKQYDVTVRIVYENDRRDDLIFTYTVPYNDKFETKFNIEQKYYISRINFNAAGVSVSRSRQEIKIDKVTSPVEIIIVVQ